MLALQGQDIPWVVGRSVGLREVDWDCAGQLSSAPDVVEEGEGGDRLGVDQVHLARVLVAALLRLDLKENVRKCNRRWDQAVFLGQAVFKQLLKLLNTLFANTYNSVWAGQCTEKIQATISKTELSFNFPEPCLYEPLSQDNTHKIQSSFT